MYYIQKKVARIKKPQATSKTVSSMTAIPSTVYSNIGKQEIVHFILLRGTPGFSSILLYKCKRKDIIGFVQGMRLKGMKIEVSAKKSKHNKTRLCRIAWKDIQCRASSADETNNKQNRDMEHAFKLP